MPMTKVFPIVVDCQGCGVCCRHIGYPPFVRPKGNHPGEHWWQVLPPDLRTELDAFVAQYEPRNYDGTVDTLDGPCCWFNQETGLCKHHLHRPNVCRDFEPGSSGCREWRAYYQVDSKTRSE